MEAFNFSTTVAPASTSIAVDDSNNPITKISQIVSIVYSSILFLGTIYTYNYQFPVHFS